MDETENELLEDTPTIYDLLEGNITFPTYDSDTEAGDAGLTKGMLYQTSNGVLMVKL
mgnify:CR=1 FL=1|tara:strand:+ start:42 stop:212 length:171 start_codon:yes stop_codon:yes gene_type:complete